MRNKATTILHKTWLLKGFVHSAPGYTLIENEHISFVLLDTGTFSEKGIREIAAQHDVSDLYEKLTNDQPTELFRVNLAQIEQFNFPWYSFGNGATLRIEGLDVKLSFVQPQNTKFPFDKLDGIIGDAREILEIGKDLKQGSTFGKYLRGLLENK